MFEVLALTNLLNIHDITYTHTLSVVISTIYIMPIGSDYQELIISSFINILAIKYTNFKIEKLHLADT